ncbi:membrane protein [Tremella mesenterica]|uniref:Membrane protein n=1 Tax=Tremella mesenterica TaxID=5217 RepID=A0A4Q1BFZ4_TREME|nr:membrane protein [Tremella mesenterica]
MATTMGETKPVGNNGTDTASVGGYNEGGAMRRFITPGGHPIDTSQPAFPVFHRKFANPSPLGLLGFAATTFVLSMYNVQARHIATPNVVLGMALGYGGLVQLIAGIEEWACGNTFAATALSSYGGFWFSFATLYIPQFAVAAAYTVPGEFENAVGIYLVSWSIITFIFFIASLRSSVALISLFFFLDITFWCLVGGFLGPSEKAVKAGGAFGILTAAIAAYTALAGLLTRDTSYFLIPVGDLTRK